MTVDVEVNGRMRAVSVERTKGRDPATWRFRVTLDGRTRLVDVRRHGPFGLSLIFPDEAGASLDVAAAEAGPQGEWTVHLPAGTVRAIVDGRRRAPRAGDPDGTLDGEQRIVAPMPGRVVRVLVGIGDEVALRQGLVVVEAMKMENELGSPKAGRVKDVQVSPGTSVEAGRVLIVVE